MQHVMVTCCRSYNKVCLFGNDFVLLREKERETFIWPLEAKTVSLHMDPITLQLCCLNC